MDQPIYRFMPSNKTQPVEVELVSGTISWPESDVSSNATIPVNTGLMRYTPKSGPVEQYQIIRARVSAPGEVTVDAIPFAGRIGPVERVPVVELREV